MYLITNCLLTVYCRYKGVLKSNQITRLCAGLPPGMALRANSNDFITLAECMNFMRSFSTISTTITKNNEITKILIQIICGAKQDLT